MMRSSFQPLRYPRPPPAKRTYPHLCKDLPHPSGLIERWNKRYAHRHNIPSSCGYPRSTGGALSSSRAITRFLSRYFTSPLAPIARQRGDTFFSPLELALDGIGYQIMRYRLGSTCLRIGFFLIQIRVGYLAVRQGYIFRGVISHTTMPYAVV